VKDHIHSHATDRAYQILLRCSCGQRLNKRGNMFQHRLVHPSKDSTCQLLIEGVDFIDADDPWTVELPLRQIV
jgi:hypothetical protein